MAVLLDGRRRYECPNCTTTAMHAGPGSPYHVCRGLRGLNAPLTPVGVRAHVAAMEREDYVRGDSPQCDGEGRPVMAIVTTRDDGQDCTVLAPCVTGEAVA